MAPDAGLSARPSPAQAMAIVRLWKTTHVPDYVGLIVLLLGWVMVALLVRPFHRFFFVNDHQISFPYAEHERVPVSMNFVYALFIPLGVLAGVNFIMGASTRKHEATYLPLFISVTLASLLTDILKNAVGRPRPDLLARCVPAPDTAAGVPVDISVCTTSHDSHTLQDGWRSFPSGHSSFSFAGLGFVALFLAGQLGVFRQGSRDLVRALICLVPLVGATMVAVSRCEDYRHDVYDVCFGSALGYAVAHWSYRRHWPRLSSQRCHEPYPPPGVVDTSADTAWQRVRDEEEAGDDVGLEMDTLDNNQG